MNGAERILLVDNEEAEVFYLREKLIIAGGYSVYLESNAKDAFQTFKEEGFAVAILNLNIPSLVGLGGMNFMRDLKRVDPYCIIIGIIERLNPALAKELYRLGVYEVIDKPINLEKLFFLVRKGLELRALNISHAKLLQSIQEQNISLQKQNTLLAKRIEESTKNLTRLYEDLRTTYMRTIKVLAKAIDARDHYTHSHSENVTRYAVAIAEEMGLSLKEIELIREACELHDLGKIAVEDNILSKPAELNEEEWEKIKQHPLVAGEILEPLTFLNGAIALIRQHHEHYDGSGYPKGLKGDEILLGARIIHLADAYDAMRSARSYRKVPLSKEEAIEEIKRKSGSQFDPKVVEVFLRIVDKL